MPRAEFTKSTIAAAFERTGGRCQSCNAIPKRPQYDHITPCAFGGGNDLDNCALLCPGCHHEKTGKTDLPAIAKSNRIRARRAGIRKRRKFRGWRRFDDSIVWAK